MTASRGRVETLIVGRAYTLRSAASASELLGPLARFCRQDMTQAAWRAELDRVTADLLGTTLLDGHRLADRDELRRRIGPHHASGWPQLADRLLPALALGIAADDTKTLSRLTSRDAWAAAIVARARGHWVQGPPPSPPALCDAFAWQRLGFAGKPKRLPAEVRSLFLQQELSVAAAPPDRLVRQLAARELGVPRADARALREGLVRAWLAERAIGASRAFADHRPHDRDRVRNRSPRRYMGHFLVGSRARRRWGWGHGRVPAKIGDLPIDKVTYAVIEDLKLALAKKKISRVDPDKVDEARTLSPKTINNCLTGLRRMLVVARKRGLIEHVPDVEWLRAPAPDFDFLDFPEADRLVAATQGQLRTMILVGLRTGIRHGEILALRWQNVDLVAGRIMVRQNVVRGIGGTPKSGKPREIASAMTSALR